tara:strand:+ start:11088 stop:12014 length:927 start_codon:yes stop_codon:yes gene_type:complete
MGDLKKAVDLENGNQKAADKLAASSETTRLRNMGIGGDPIKEPVPNFISCDTEKVYKMANSWVVLGRDRHASRLSGYGGKGYTQCASIDMVVGRMAYQPTEFEDDEPVYVDPSFKTDAARIYISQKTDVDKNFALAPGAVGTADTKSAVALKADQIRVIAREGIKLVTKTDLTNSQGADVKGVSGVDIIAGNDDENLQPMVLGNNLEMALQRIVHHMDKLNGIVDSLCMIQMTFNSQLASHFHFSPFYGMPTSPSPPVVAGGIKAAIDMLTQVKLGLMMHKTNLVMMENTYLVVSGGKYINSAYNNVN